MAEPKKWWTTGAEAEGPEHPEPAPEDAAEQEVGRRGFLATVGFGAAVTAMACSSPRRQALPFLEQPEELVPGESSIYATTCAGCAASCGLRVEVRDGRPIKVEGNPEHPVSRGGVCSRGHAALMGLYDSSRPEQPSIGGEPVEWARFDREVRAAIDAARAGDKQTWIVTGERPRSSPTTRALVARFMERTGATHLAFEAIAPGAIASAHGHSHAWAAIPDYRFDRADLVVSFGADFLGTWLEPVAFARRWAERRRLDRRRPMGRVVQLEGYLSLTGASADERIRLAPSERHSTLAALARRLLARARATDTAELQGILRDAGESPVSAATLDRLAAELWELRTRSLVVCDSSELRDQLLVNRINEACDAYGHTLDVSATRPLAPVPTEDLGALLESLRAGRTGVVIFWDANPVYSSPQGAALREALDRAQASIAIVDRKSETAAACRFVAPETHSMESWGDSEPRLGLVTLRQPTFRPLGDRRSGEDGLLRWMGERGDWLAWLRGSWARNVQPAQSATPLFTSTWDGALARGFVEARVETWLAPDGTEPRYGDRVVPVPPPPPEVVPAEAALVEGTVPGEVLDVPYVIAEPAPAPGPRFDPASLVTALRASRAIERGPGDYELVAHADARLGTGRDANNPWLHELPDPITKVTWDNVATLSEASASRLGVVDGDLIELTAGDTQVRVPVIVQPGVHDRVVAVPIGFGRTAAGPVAEGVGADVFPLLEPGHPSATNVSIRSAGQRVELALSQTQPTAAGRPMIKEATFGEWMREPSAGNEREHIGLPLWGTHPRPGRRWGMAIDLSACTGCGSCVVSCNVENNVAVVGKDEVRRRREMHWMRIDRYYAGSASDPDVAFQPMLCQHCDAAPCETVCPVLATMQSSEGLNQMAYNRCVGTRYCANNCPYKVRRFNWLDYPREDATANLALNPDVVVRSRGVMEKCSLCVQRIQEGRWRARREGRELVDGDIKTACQESCPTQAIVFGDLNDRDSRVAQAKRDPRTYRVLEELHVEPVVHYQTKIRNREEE